MRFRLSLACIRRFQLRARLGPSWRIGTPPSRNPTVQISAAGSSSGFPASPQGSSPGSGR
jgi:hypothetical protein